MLYIYTLTHTHTHTYVCIYKLYIYICVCVCVCVCMYVYYLYICIYIYIISKISNNIICNYIDKLILIHVSSGSSQDKDKEMITQVCLEEEEGIKI